MLFPTDGVVMEELSDDLFSKKQVFLYVLRLDNIHQVVSGNKLFKLHYFLKNAVQQSSEGIVTFGGAWSNHLVATAFACKELGVKSVGIIRGESPAVLSDTLDRCREYGMQLEFISRTRYSEKEQPGFLYEITSVFKKYYIVPEGGYHPLGAAGASLIMDFIDDDVTHICCAVGSATTLTGLLQGLKKKQQLIGIPVLKNLHDLEKRISFLGNHFFDPLQLKIMNDYHFGGYAKKNKVLIDFMNTLYQQHHLPTDFVYTGKMMFGIIDGIRKNIFPKGSKIVCIHTGGLQGNLSLKPGALVF